MSDKYLRTRRAGLFVGLVVLLASVYMITYSGRIESGDSLLYFNATGSFVHFGDSALDVTLWFSPPDVDDFSAPYPLKPLEIESLSPAYQPILASGLYWLADQVPGIGLVHTVWLFNVFVVALAGGVLFLCALALGYDEQTAVLGGLALGLCTVFWPYSKTFFRDPLALLLILLVGLLIERLRLKRFRSPGLWAGLVLSVLVGLHTKTTVVFALPGLLLIAAPDLQRYRWIRRGLNSALMLLVAVLFVLVFSPILGSDPYASYYVFGRFGLEPFHLRNALQSYVFSIGGSVWGTSPVVLLALPGIWMLYRRGHSRYIWVTLSIVLAYVFGYAVLSQSYWFGGVSWPPRFLLPVVPFLILLTLPVWQRLIHTRPVSRLLMVVVGLLVLYSLWIQFSAASLEWALYTEGLPPEANQLLEWGPGLNDIQYLRWVIIPQLWAKHPLDFAWVRVGVPGWLAAFSGFAVVCAAGLWRWLRRPFGNSGGRLWLLILGLPAVFTGLTVWGLHSIYADPVYLGGNESLHKMLQMVGDVSAPGDMLILNSNRYERFFLNYGKMDNPRVVTLPVQPGEQPSEEQPPQVVSDNPDVLLTAETVPLLHELARQHDRLWLLMETGPFMPWSVRPVERFMASHYYLVSELQTTPPDPSLRLLEYSTVDAPDPFAFAGPDYLANLVFGDSVYLIGCTLPAGNRLAAGESVPLTLYWQTETPLEQDYTISGKLLDADGRVSASSIDSQPVAGFARTSDWQPGLAVLDNRVIRLPADLAPGDYELAVTVYYLNAAGGIENLPASGGAVLEGFIGILPVTVTVQGDRS